MQILNLFFCLQLFSILPSAAETVYGEGKFRSLPVGLEALLTDFEKFKGQKVVTEGSVIEVCARAGCWIILKDGKSEVRVLMIDHGFAVPKTLKGQRVQVEGKIVKKELPPELLKHYLKDAGKSQKEIAKVQEAKVVFQFIATGVRSL